MTPKETDPEFDNLRFGLKNAESRMDDVETKQKNAADRFEEMYKLLLERVSAKDNTLNLLKDQSEWTLRQNDTLLKQIGLRWNVLTGFTAFVALAFTIVFSYQIWKVEQVGETQKQLERSAANADQINRLLSENSKDYSSILSTLAQADTLVTESNREFLRAEYLVAANRAGEAIEALYPVLQQTGVPPKEIESRKLLYSPTSCNLTAVQSAATAAIPPPSISALSPKALQAAVRDALFTAYDQRARANFFLARRDDVGNDGLMLLALNDLRWEGYHWLGLSAEDARLIPVATQCFHHSVEKNSLANKDYVNLAELSFIDSHFLEAVSYSEQYLRPLNRADSDQYRFKTSLDVVAQFYFSAAALLGNDAAATQLMPPHLFLENVRKLGPEFSLEGTFSTKDLDKFLKSNEYTRKVSNNLQIVVQRLVHCLESRSCSDSTTAQ